MAYQTYQGGCFCGALRYEIRGEPTGTMICHCRTCRRLTVGLVVAWLSVPASKFRVTKGSPTRFNSSGHIERSFCCNCGTHICYTNKHDESEVNEIEVATCSLDNPDAFPPTHHSWLDHDLDWVKFGDDLPTFRRSRYEGAA